MANINPYIPTSDNPWNKEKVIHLYQRLGMGATPTEIDLALQTDPQIFINNLLDNTKNRPLPAPPIWANYTAADYENTDNLIFEHRTELIYSLYTDMVNDGIRSKLFLFWHNHFVTELGVYNCNKYLWNYYFLLNQFGLGNFKTFVLEMGKSPAMLDYLNGNLNRVGSPNENYARELMELFTMGENNGYTQTDVVEVARALTGWTCNASTCNNVSFNNNRFDKNNKTIFGKTGNWNYNDVHDLIFTERKDQVAVFICEKMYRFFIHKKPDNQFISELALLFQQNNWELLPVFKALFQSEHFFDEKYAGAIIKSPIECFIGMVRAVDITAPNIQSRFNTFRYGAGELGMYIFDPINVAGWPGHEDWINETTLTQRWEFCRQIITTFTNETNRAALRNFAIKVSVPTMNDPDVITKAITLHFLGRDLDEDLHQAALLYFKGDIPENYYEDNTWNLNWNEVPFQVGNLLTFLSKLPEFQLA